MRQFNITALLGVLLCLALAPAAPAGVPFTVGEGKRPHLLVDPGGTAHVVWAREDGGFNEAHYCRVPRGATACDVHRTLPTAPIEAPNDVGETFILRRPAGTLFLVMQRYVSSDVWLWESTDNGATWSAPRKIYDWSNSTDFGEPALNAAGDEITFTVANTADAVFAAKVDGSEAGVSAHADLDDSVNSNLDYNLEAVPTADGGMVAVQSSLASVYFWRMAPGGNPSVSGSWGAPQEIGPTQDPAQLAGGSSGQFVLYPESNRMVVRKWNGSAFGAPVVAAPELGYMHDITVNGPGTVGAIWRRNGAPNQLRFAMSSDSGGSFAVRTVAREDDVYFDLDLSQADDNQGFYVYAKGHPATGARDYIRVGDLTEVAEPPPTVPPSPSPTPTPTPPPDPAVYGYPGAVYSGPIRRRSVIDRDKRLTFQTPGHCVRPGQRFRVRLTWARKKRKGNLFVKVRRADFFINRRRVKIDRKAPFTQLLTVTASAQRGSTVRLRARAYIKVKRGKSPTKSIRALFKVCL